MELNNTISRQCFIAVRQGRGPKHGIGKLFYLWNEGRKGNKLNHQIRIKEDSGGM
jgi:hypothetical protein